MSVYEVALADPTHLSRPAVELLRISAVGDLAFVAVCKHDEGNPESKDTVVAEMTVSLPALREAVELLSHDRDRESLRPRDQRGEPMSDIAGNRFVVAPL